MRQNLTISLDEDTCERLEELAQGLGYPPELAAVYAIRLVSACMREGLIADIVPLASHAQEGSLVQHRGKVLAFDPRAPRKAAARRRRV